MKPFDNILFPFDFSEAAFAMALDVTAMARKFDALVTVLHAFDIVREYNLAPRIDAPFGPEPGAIPYVPALQELRKIRQNRLDEFVRKHLAGIRTKTIVEDGDPELAIEYAAREKRADLIMMPTRGMGRFRRMLLGSLTAKVLHDVECPVYTSAHEPGEAPVSPDGFKSIVCAVRMEPESAAALRAAGTLAEAFGARVCLLHIHTPAEAKGHEATALGIEAAFEQVLGPAAGSVAIRGRILDAAVPEGIRKAAAEEGANLVVVGRGHARRGVSHFWSHLYTLIRESPCPVMSV
jgi:nucleotide-binding universal stress UspA family protein